MDHSSLMLAAAVRLVIRTTTLNGLRSFGRSLPVNSTDSPALARRTASCQTSRPASKKVTRLR